MYIDGEASLLTSLATFGEQHHAVPWYRMRNHRYFAGRHGPYGRRPGSRPLVEDAQRLTRDELLKMPGVALDVQPMPNGGIRMYWQCPGCQQRRAYLYRTDKGIRCQACAQLRYTSSYAGRRLEASPERIDAALATLALRTRHDAVYARRWKRAMEACALDMARQSAWRARFYAASDVMLALDALQCRRLELRIARWQAKDAAASERRAAVAKVKALQAQVKRDRDRFQAAHAAWVAVQAREEQAS